MSRLTIAVLAEAREDLSSERTFLSLKSMVQRYYDDYNAITSSSIPYHNLLFRRCQSLLGRNGATRALKEPRSANWGGAGGEPGASGIGEAGGGLLPSLLFNLKERRMNMPATKINKRRITFRWMLRRWYPVATVSSLS